MRARSPFPGMDPWLENHWNGVRGTMIVDLRRHLSRQLPGELYAEIEENVYVVDTDQAGKLFRPDAGIFDPQNNLIRPWRSADESNLAVAEPIRLLFTNEPIVEGHIEIRDVRADNKLVNVIEALSSTKKHDLRAHSTYASKREAYYTADANVMELDLLRAGMPTIGLPAEYAEPILTVPYKCVIRRSKPPEGKTRMDYYRMSPRLPLPPIKVPLPPGDEEIELDPGSPLDAAYEEGRFGMRIDYSTPPVPPALP